MDTIFSLAQEADAAEVYALYRSMIGTPDCTWSDDYPGEEIVHRDIRTQSLYILRDAQGQLAAAAAAGPDDELRDFPWDMQNPCELARVAVALPLQNRGIGSLLLRSVIAAVKARGFDGIRMLVNTRHPHALALYDKNAFTRLDAVHLYGHEFYRYRMVF